MLPAIDHGTGMGWDGMVWYGLYGWWLRRMESRYDLCRNEAWYEMLGGARRFPPFHLVAQLPAASPTRELRSV